MTNLYEAGDINTVDGTLTLETLVPTGHGATQMVVTP